MDVKILKKENRDVWDEFVDSHKEGRFVHLSAYKDIIEQTYGYKGHFLYIEKNENILAIFPFFKIRTIFFQNKFISQPFNEYGGILFKEELDEKEKKEIILCLKDYSKKLFPNQKDFCIEIHGQQDEPDFVSRHLTKRPLYKIAILKLDSYDSIYKKFDRQIKKAINKAQREGVKVCEETSLKSIKDKFYPLYSRYLKKRHGIPPYPLKFFLNCYRYAPENIRIYFAQVNNKIIAALWGFLADKRVQIIYNPSLEKYFSLRPNDLVHAEFIKWACENKFEYFDFGPAVYPGQTHYKEKWGVDFLDYSHFYLSDKTVKTRPYISSKSGSVKKVLCLFWKYLVPGFLAKSISGFIRKKLGR